MRIKGVKKRYKFRPGKGLFIAAIALFGIIALLAYAGKKLDEEFYFCDMEKTLDGGEFFKATGYRFNGMKFSGYKIKRGKTQSRDKAFSGHYASRCDENNRYGPEIDLKNVHSGEVIQASVWRQIDDGFGVLVFQGQGDWKFYAQAKQAVKTSGDWELIEKTITIPIGVDNQTLKVYPYFQKSSIGVVYFDDFKVKRTKNIKPAIAEESSFDGAKLNLIVDEKGLKNMKAKRSEALASGVLLVGKKDLVKAKLKIPGREISAKARLKGDLLDHLMGRKWSFRILTEGNTSWRGMTEFSVHNSLSRHHLDEWLFHQFLQREDVLTTRYDFVEMALNDNVLGIYAYEEHFRDALLRHQERVPAPIIRWNEEGLWRNVPKQFKRRPPWYESANIEPFGGKKIWKDNEQLAYYKSAQNLLYGMRRGDKKAAEVFDTARLAKFLAIVDICTAYHALNHTNLRFYFNPTTGKLEPVGYDGYTPEGTQFFKLPLMNGSKINDRTPKTFMDPGNRGFIHYWLFNDFEFAETYIHYLDQLSSPEFLATFKSETLKDLKSREAFIRREYSDYRFDWDYFFRNAAEIRKNLFPLEELSLKAWRSGGDKIILESYHPLPLEIIGFGDKQPDYRPKKRLILESFNEKLSVRRHAVPYRGNAKNVFCKTLGTKKVVKFSIFKWDTPTDQPALPRADLEKLQAFHFLTIGKDSVVYIQKGTHQLTRDLLIPAGFTLQMTAGTELNLENGASVVTYGPLRFIGTKESPVVIRSKNKTGQGLLVLNADQKSVLQNVVFNNLNARKKFGQFTTAAVTFYQTEVQLDHCYFTDAHAKDALSFIHSNYQIVECYFENTAADALDANFSAGKLDALFFEKIGKDAIEISGGYADIGKVNASRIFGASLKVNLHATASAQTIVAHESEKGIVATDLSDLKINELQLKNVKQGILVFQNLPEFGGGNVEIKKYEPAEVGQLHWVEMGLF